MKKTQNHAFGHNGVQTAKLILHAGCNYITQSDLLKGKLVRTNRATSM